MGGEDIGRSDNLERGVEIQFLIGHFSANPLEREKGRVPFIHVEDFRLEPERVERFHAADPEHDFLAHSHLLIAAIELGRNQPIFGIVFRNVGVEQEQVDSADLELPKLRQNFAV